MSTTAVLPFQIDFEKSDLRTTSYKTTVTTTVNAVQTTETKKKEVPLIAAGASLHNVLHCINEFYNAKKILNWTTGNKLFQNIEDIFEDPQDQTYWEMTLATNNSRSVAQFDTFIKEYIAEKFSNNTKAYRIHKRFLNNIKKTRTLSVHQFVSLVQYHNRNLLPLLPGAPATEASFPPEEIKDIIFNSMPEDWRDAFDLQFDIDSSSLPTLVKYMEKRNTIEKRKNPKQEKNSKKTDSDSKDENKNNQQGSGKKQNKGRGKGRGKQQNGNRPSNQQSGRIKDTDPCPLPGHSGHNWGQCFQNINNPNANRRQNNGNRDNNCDNHMNENNGTNRTGGNNDRNNSNDRNPQQADNYYCSIATDRTTEMDYTDLFHVDCEVDENYFNEDLQRFPTVEEAFNAESENKTQEQSTVDLAPTTVTVCNQINDGSKRRIYLKTLFDSGSTDNIVSKTTLPKDTGYHRLAVPITMRTAQGSYECTEYCYLNNIMFPELSLTRKCKTIKCLVIDKTMGYQLIIGRRYMKEIEIQMDFATSTIQWLGKEMTFHQRNYFADNNIIRKILTNEPYSIAEAYANQTHTYVLKYIFGD